MAKLTQPDTRLKSLRVRSSYQPWNQPRGARCAAVCESAGIDGQLGGHSLSAVEATPADGGNSQEADIHAGTKLAQEGASWTAAALMHNRFWHEGSGLPRVGAVIHTATSD
jgi:hypothetical protein